MKTMNVIKVEGLRTVFKKFRDERQKFEKVKGFALAKNLQEPKSKHAHFIETKNIVKPKSIYKKRVIGECVNHQTTISYINNVMDFYRRPFFKRTNVFNRITQILPSNGNSMLFHF